MNRGDGQVYKRGETFWIDYFHRGRRYRESAHTDNERKARKLLRERLTDFGRGKTGAATAAKVTFERMAEALLADYRINQKRSLASADLSIRHLRDFFGDDLAADITTQRVRVYVEERQAQGYANASINRELSALRRAFNLLVKDGVLEHAPHVPMLEENNARQGFLEPSDFDRLLAALPDYLKDPINFMYCSGWRVGEMRTLGWRDVSLTGREIRLRPEHSKNKKGRPVPLRGRLLTIIERAREQRRMYCLFVFHHDGQPIGDFRKAWRSACRAAGLPPLLIHDLRRSGVRNMRRSGMSETEAMRVSGHRTRAVFDRYDIISNADLERGFDQLDVYLDSEAGKQSKVAPLKSAS